MYTTSIKDNFKLRSDTEVVQRSVCVCVCVCAEFIVVLYLGIQQTDGSSTAAAPSVTALTHLAIVWEALLMESEQEQV